MMEEQLGLFDQFEDNVEDDIFSKMTIEGDPPITFRYGVVGEEEIIQDIAKEFMKELGWVRLPQVRLWIKNKWCIVAEAEGKIVAFNLLTVVKKRRTGLTSNSICISSDFLRRGIGRKFREYAIELLEKRGWQTIIAKCIHQSRANYLNQSMGFKLIRFDAGKRIPLNVWCYYNKSIPESYHEPDLSDQFDWSLITDRPAKEVEREERRKEREQNKKERKKKDPKEKSSVVFRSKFLETTTEEDRIELARKIALLRLDPESNRPLSWRKIREHEEISLANDDFHKVIRISEYYENVMLERLGELIDHGWSYKGSLETLCGFGVPEEIIERMDANIRVDRKYKRPKS